jgi:hypothetical protein
MQICRRIIPYLLAETTNCRGTLAFGSRRKVALEITAAGLTEAPHHHHSAQCPGALPIKTHKKIIFGCKRALIVEDDYFLASDLASGLAAFSSAPAPFVDGTDVDGIGLGRIPTDFSSVYWPLTRHCHQCRLKAEPSCM